MNYPSGCTSLRARLHCCLFIEEVLRKIHNRFGYWYKNGITQTQYDKGVTVLAHVLKRIKYPGQTIAALKTAIQNKYPYVAQLSSADWVMFIKEDWEPLSGELSALIPDFKMQIKVTIDWDLGDIPDIN